MTCFHHGPVTRFLWKCYRSLTAIIAGMKPWIPDIRGTARIACHPELNRFSPFSSTSVCSERLINLYEASSSLLRVAVNVRIDRSGDVHLKICLNWNFENFQNFLSNSFRCSFCSRETATALVSAILTETWYSPSLSVLSVGRLINLFVTFCFCWLLPVVLFPWPAAFVISECVSVPLPVWGGVSGSEGAN